MANETFIVCENLVKIYKLADLEVVALQGLDLEVAAGEMVALVGSSGSGKSTLLNILGSFDTPSAGQVVVAGYDLLDMRQSDRVVYKQDVIGFVWQQPSRNLLPYLTAAENVALPMTSGRNNGRVRDLLALFDLSSQADLHPAQLSGGQQQRVALAVALANNPRLILADEPTGQIDSAAAQALFDSLHKINEEFGTTILLVTHDPSVAARVDRVVSIRDGRTSTEIRRERRAGESGDLEEEWVILDRVGRLQIPAVYLDTLAMKGRVKLRREPDHLSVWPSRDADPSSDDKGMPKQWRPEAAILLQQEMRVDPPKADAIRTEHLVRLFGAGETAVRAVDDLNLVIPHGVFALLKGRSGSGKTTLLNLLGGLDEPTSGQSWIYDLALAGMSEKQRVHLRRDNVSYIFQTFGLLPFLTARENVEVAFRLHQVPHLERLQRADELLSLVGLTERAHHRVHELSGGEQQRVAVARALASKPWLILADEPTGQLDATTGSEIIALLRQVVDELNATVLVASHDPKVEEAADFVFGMQDGRLVE
jgi:peptide/nickel transport system ATP-binding protein